MTLAEAIQQLAEDVARFNADIIDLDKIDERAALALCVDRNADETAGEGRR